MLHTNFSAGDLGDSVSEAEELLKFYFYISHKEGYILLFENVDPFMDIRARGQDVELSAGKSLLLCPLYRLPGCQVETLKFYCGPSKPVMASYSFSRKTSQLYQWTSVVSFTWQLNTRS